MEIKWITINGVHMSLNEWLDKANIDEDEYWRQVWEGKTDEQIFSEACVINEPKKRRRHLEWVHYGANAGMYDWVYEEE